MVNEFGILSVLPPVLAIILALRTKQVYISLVVGIWLGWLIISDWNVLSPHWRDLWRYLNLLEIPEPSCSAHWWVPS